MNFIYLNRNKSIYAHKQLEFYKDIYLHLNRLKKKKVYIHLRNGGGLIEMIRV